MLSNKDFLGLMEEGGEKKKFDLNQVKQWDQQNDNMRKKSANQAQKRKEGKDKHKDDEKRNEPEYRDRAQERRLDANPDYDPQFNIVETLDVEQTKFLGGDAQHTHLVKGLDYALLRKMRKQEKEQQKQQEEERKEEEGGSSAGVMMSAMGSGGSGVIHMKAETSTALGLSIKQALRAAALQKSQGLGGGARGHTMTGNKGRADGGVSVLQRTAFEYDVDLVCDDELPTTVLRSQELAADMSHLFGHYGAGSEDRRVYVTPPSILQALTAALNGSSLDKKKLKSKQRRKNDDSDVTSSEPDPGASSSSSSASASSSSALSAADTAKDVKPAVVNIFDDLDPSTTYIPSSSSSALVTTQMVPQTIPQEQPKQMNYFSTSATSDESAQGDEARGDKKSEKEERMASVVELLRAQQARENAKDQAKQQASEGRKAGGGGMVVAPGVAHRDIFGGGVFGSGGLDSKGNMGDAMAGGGASYDVYPESGDFETYDSDTEEPEGKSVTVGGGKGKGGKAKSKDGAQGEKSSGSGGGGGGKEAGGLNRAQRRALARKEQDDGGDRKRSKTSN